ncbi:MAG TPA: translocation/assembly module TamB domain-containing protein, partial [Gammaproteobacteria bacterium]
LSPRGELDWSGTPAAWRYRLAGLLQVQDQGELDLLLEGDGDREGMRLAELRLALLDGTVRGQGALRWQPEPGWDLTLAMDGINPGAWYPDWPGRLAATVQATGSLQGEQLRNRLQLQDLAGELRGQALQGQGLLIQRGEQLAVEDLELRSGQGRLALQGSLGEQWQANWTLDIPDLAELLPGGQGRLVGSGQVNGPRQQPRLQARLEGAGLAWERQAVERLALDLDWDIQGRWDLRLEAMELRHGAETLASLTAGVQGTAADHRLELAARRSDAALDLVLAGRWREAQWQGRILQADWQQEPLGVWSLRQPAGLQASATGGRLESLCWQRETAALCLTGEGDREQGWTTELGMERLPLAWLEFLLPPGRQAQGQLDARLQARLGPDFGPVEGRLQATLSPGQLRLGQVEDQVLEFGGGRLEGHLKNDRAELGLELFLAGNDRLQGDWVVTGIGSRAAQLSGGLRGDLRELALVEAFTGEVEGVRGHLMIDLRTQGPLREPQIAGRLSLEQGQVAVPAAGIRLEDLRLVLDAEDAARIRIQGGARSGPEGELRVEGLLRDAQSSDWRLQLGIQGERFLVVDIPEYQVRFTPDLQLEVVPRRVDLTGEVLVPQARLQPRDFSGAVGPSRDVVLVGNGVESEPVSPWAVHANLLLRLGKDVQVDAFGLRGFIDGGLRLIEEPGQPTRGRGALAIRDGRYRAYGQDLRIETGRLLYTDSPLDNPGLDIRAARHVNEIVAGIRVGGQLRDPVLSLYSDPAMSESDTLSYLLFGRPMQQASDAEGASMMQAASALGLGGGGLLAAQIGETFGFDEVEIGGSGAG